MPTTTTTTTTTTTNRLTPEGRRSRTDLVREAVLFDLRGYDGQWLSADQMQQARHVARDSMELHLILRRLWLGKVLDRQGRGYHQGDPYRYRAGERAGA